jgi:hypothetical protein
MTALFWLIVAFAVLVFGIIIAIELKKAPIINSNQEDYYGANSIHNRLRDIRALRDLRSPKPEQSRA